ncbi:MAG TPA: M28 family peptidase [Aliidongia sp.]|nr:M28 family peptidase [Aliidongia sp.]
MDDRTQRILDEVSIDLPWRLVEEFAVLPRCLPEDVNRGADRIAAHLAAEGVPVTMHDAEIYLSIPLHAEVRAGGKVFRGKPPSYSTSCPDGIEGELIYVPAAYSKSISTLFEQTKASDAVRGKIVISEGYALPGKVAEMESAGALGVIAINPGTDVHWGICTPIWGSPGLEDLPRKPNIPVVAINNPDGLALIELARAGGRVTIATRLEEGWYSQKLPVVEIPGRHEPDRFVLLHGHYDSWDVGVGDNATGDATLLEIARVLWRQRDALDRSVRIAWWPGHSTGRYAGSTWYADRFAAELDEGCVAQINCDSPGCRWATTYLNLSVMSEAEDFLVRQIREISDGPIGPERPLRAGDYSFNNIGLSGLLMLSSTMTTEDREARGYYAVGGCGGNIAWHTENDTLEIADREVMVRDIKLYLLSVLGVANAPLLPFDWRATAREFERTIERYQDAAGAAFDLGPARAALAAFAELLGRLYGCAVPTEKANEAILRLARILVPLNYTRGPRFGHDPAMSVPALPSLAMALEIAALDPSLQPFARTQLIRGQNRFLGALAEARRVVAWAIG